MNIQLYRYEPGKGWDTPPDASLDSEQTLLIVFSGLTDRNLSAQLGMLRQKFPLSCITGCSTAGEIYDAELYLESLVVSVMRLSGTHIRMAIRTSEDTGNSLDAGKEIARELEAPDLKAVFVLSEGLHVNASQLVAGLNSVLDNHVVITGGLAGDGDRFSHTWLITGDTFDRACVSAIGFYGDRIEIAHGSRGGWSLLGFEKEVTRSEGNVLFELDGQPALQIYKKYLGERASGLPSTGLLFPLALRSDDRDEENRVRTILSVDEDKQSITFAGDIPQGSRVQLMHASVDRLIDGAAQAAANAGITCDFGEPVFSIAISCVGRRLVLGQRTEEEIESVMEQLPPGTRQIGFYSYGELSPLATGECDLHNQTMTLTLLKEA